MYQALTHSRLLVSVILAGGVLTLPTMAANAGNGARVIETQGCLECHTIRGQGAGHETLFPAKDLASRLQARYSPAALASALWNHTPQMWAQIDARNTAAVGATEAQWSDVFAYLYSLQFADPGGQVARGKQVLNNKGCVKCHALLEPDSTGPGSAVSTWQLMDDPVALVYQMWNHAPTMRDRIQANRRDWQELSSRDFLDLTAYIQSVQELPPNESFQLPDPAEGKPVFERHCAQCHTGSMSLANRLRETKPGNSTWMDIGAAMWNHAPQMQAVPLVREEDMRKILAYVWELQYQGPVGSVYQGQRAFTQKGCQMCHQQPDGSFQHPRPGKQITPFTFATLAWGPNRRMHDAIRQTGTWPELSTADIANLSAFLNAQAGLK